MLQMSSKNDQKYKIYFKTKMDNNKNDRKQFIATNTVNTICGQGLSQNGEKTMMTDNCDVDDCDDDDFEDGD